MGSNTHKSNSQVTTSDQYNEMHTKNDVSNIGVVNNHLNYEKVTNGQSVGGGMYTIAQIMNPNGAELRVYLI
jgi:hypothetical protein